MSCLVDFNRNLQSPCWSTLPSPYCLFSPYISNFLLFLLPPSRIQKREPVCYWLQLCSHLFSRFCVTLCLNLLPFMLPFSMLLLFLAHPTHGYQTRSCALFHTASLRVPTVASYDGNQGRIVNRFPLSMRDCRPLICHTESDHDFIANSSKGIKAFGLKTSE